ncbi:MAG: hypothetical protein M0Z66_16070 [Thermaerobacter sp.]|nr:hypothetical protein [Thermaerobacter sp.]
MANNNVGRMLDELRRKIESGPFDPTGEVVTNYVVNLMLAMSELNDAVLALEAANRAAQ